MNKMTRRRFLTDLAFIGGGLLCAVGGAWVTQPAAEAAPAQPSPKPSPSPRPMLRGEPVAPPNPSPKAVPSPQVDRPMVPGEMVAPPAASPQRPLPGKMKAPNKKP